MTIESLSQHFGDENDHCPQPQNLRMLNGKTCEHHNNMGAEIRSAQRNG